MSLLDQLDQVLQFVTDDRKELVADNLGDTVDGNEEIEEIEEISTEKSMKKSDEEKEEEINSFYQIEDDTLRICIKLRDDDDSDNFNKTGNMISLFVLDYSGSMSSDWCQVQNAVKYFVENSVDNTYFIIYNHTAKLSNISDILLMSASGMTSFKSAFDEIKQFINGETNINEIINIIFMTDGHDTNSNDINRDLILFKQYIKNCQREITIHTIGFSSGHDRDFLSKLNEIGNFQKGIYRYAQNNDKTNLSIKFEEMFDFLAVSSSLIIKLSDITSFKVNCMLNEIDFITKISKIDINDIELLKKLKTKRWIKINENILCKYRKCDEFFHIKKVENIEILSEKDLENAQNILDSIKVNKIKKDLRSSLLISRLMIQSKLDKYYDLFAKIARGTINGNNILSELNSLRHETTFSKARQKRTMNKRISKNIKELNEIQNELNKLSKPDLKLFENYKDLQCLLSGETIIDIMSESNNNIMVFTMNVTRPEHTIDAPTNIFINKYLVGTYSMDAMQNATRFAINEIGTNKALGGFMKSSKFKYNKDDLINNDNNDDEDDEKKKDGLFRGCDGGYSNSYLPLFINNEHFKRVKIQIKPILGYFFTMDPLGFKEDQYLGLYVILGDMVCRNSKNNKNNKMYKSEWFEWLINDYTKLCQNMLPKLKDYLVNLNGFGGKIKSGDLLTEFILTPKARTKQIIQNLLLIIGLMHCKNIKTKEIEIKFIEELWRRNLSDLYKGAPRTQIEEILEKLVFEDEEKKEEKKQNVNNDNDEYLNQTQEIEYEKYAKHILRISNDTYNDKEIQKIKDFSMNNNNKNYKPYKLIDYDSNRDKLDKIVEMVLNKISKKNEWVSSYFNNKPLSGKGIDGKLRWLMVIQSLRFSSNSLMNSAVDKNEYFDGYDCLIGNKYTLEHCLKSYIESKEIYRKQNYDQIIEYKKYLLIAKNIIMSKNIYSFCGKLLFLCSTRGGKIFDNLIGLFFDNKINNKLIPLFDKKLEIIMTGKLNKYNIISCGYSWIHCPINYVIKFKSVIGSKQWKIIENQMVGTYGHRYRESDIPNRHGHCNSNPNPNLVQHFTGFNV